VADPLLPDGDESMNTNAENLGKPFSPRTGRTQADRELCLAKPSESQLRTRLLELILKSEQNRKCRLDATSTCRLIPDAQTSL